MRHASADRRSPRSLKFRGRYRARRLRARRTESTCPDNRACRRPGSECCRWDEPEGDASVRDAVRRSGALALWRSGALALWRSGALALWRSGALALWRSGALALWRSGALGSGALALWRRSGALNCIGNCTHAVPCPCRDCSQTATRLNSVRGARVSGIRCVCAPCVRLLHSRRLLSLHGLRTFFLINSIVSMTCIRIILFFKNTIGHRSSKARKSIPPSALAWTAGLAGVAQVQ